MLVLLDYQGSPIQLEEQNGQIMANATLMCKAFDKKPETWLRTESTQRYISAVAVALKCETENCYEVRQGGNVQGTWIHQKLVLNLARWLSPEFEIWCDDRLAELLRTGRTELAGRTELPTHLADNVARLSVSNRDIADSVCTMARDMATMNAYVTEMRERLMSIPMRDMKPQAPVPADRLPVVADEHIGLFWDSLSRTDMDVMKHVELRTDTHYIMVLLAGVWPAYLDYCTTCNVEPLSIKDMKKCLSHRRYAPYLPVWGKYMTFRYELKGKEVFVGGRHLPFLDVKVTG